MITPDQVKKDIQSLRTVRANVENIQSRKRTVLAKSLVVMHKANPVVAARIASDLVAKSDAELAVIEMQTVAKFSV